MIGHSSYPQTIPTTGLTVLVNPVEPNIDIIFVHGFTGHPERTWIHKKGDLQRQTHDDSLEPPLKIRKTGLFSRPHQEDVRTTVYWPRDLIPLTAPNARVLTYGYDTHIRHKLGSPVNRNTVYDIAWNFLVALEAERRTEPSRPAFFVAHSLGGIIVKQMLRRSSVCYHRQAPLRNIFLSTTGIMFFGTPHGGADPRSVLHRIAEKVIKIIGFSVNEQIVNTLLPTAERLKELRDEFGPMAHKRNWVIHSFQEQMGITALGDLQVVEDSSSYLNLPKIEITEHLERDHMNMCRFTGLSDIEYKKVAFALQRMTNSSGPSHLRGEEAPPSEEQRRMLLDSLRFDQIDARQTTIKNAHFKTCKWLLKDPQYLDWLDVGKLHEHHGFLWMKGKPGTGKSTLMKFAFANARKTMKDRLVISFFLNARGEDLEKSTIGTYRSLLLQLLERLPALQCVFDSLGLSTSIICPNYRWSIEVLRTLLEQAIQSLGDNSVICFIDALDECEERHVRDLISFFERVGELVIPSGIRFQVCFSSRHYPFITINKGLHLVLEGQEGHNQDINNYLDYELKIGHSKAASQIRTDVQEKSSGVFMWVVLVAEILNKEHDDGRIHTLRRKLQEIPSDLHELFHDILTRDSHNRKELILCIQWVLFARQPLSPEQLYYAIMSGVEPDTLSRWDPEEITADTFKRFILSSSKGLTEITASKMPKVQFIHESVKDFLLKDNGLRSIWPDLRNNFQDQSHDTLKHCCLTYMKMDISTSLESTGALPKASSPEATALRQTATATFPFLKYAVNNVLYHADQAAGNSIAQQDFMHTFPLIDWINLDNLFQKHEIRRHTQNASLLYILAENNLSNLIRIHPSISSYIEVESERYGSPLLACFATGSKEAVHSFLKSYMATQNPSNKLIEIYSQFQQDKGPENRLRRDFKFSKRRTQFSYFAELNDPTVVAILLETDHVDADSKNDFGRTPLSWAAGNGYEAVVRLLAARADVDVDAKDNAGRTPLSWAAGNGYEAVVRLLAARDNVDVDTKDGLGRTPLSRAAEKGHEAVVRLLAARDDVDVNVKDNYGQTPLSLAAEKGHETVVRLLAARDDVDVDTKDDAGQTPLWWAAGNGYEAVVRLLAARDDVDVDTKDRLGRTPLSRAAANGHEAVVRLLQERSNQSS
ncbi:MAG: hypothetical protein Q9160_008784 [Pyrenula sp. 1 TL-2023]